MDGTEMGFELVKRGKKPIAFFTANRQHIGTCLTPRDVLFRVHFLRKKAYRGVRIYDQSAKKNMLIKQIPKESDSK